jgi:hypothetical protein
VLLQLFARVLFPRQTRRLIRPGAPATRSMQHRVHLLSGDDDGTARAVAAQAGIPEADARGGMSPADKLEAIRAMQVPGAGGALVFSVQWKGSRKEHGMGQ